MDEEKHGLNAPGGENDHDHDQIDTSLEITDQVLTILGEAWAKVDKLEHEINSLKGEENPNTKVTTRPKAHVAAEGVIIIDDSKLMRTRLRSSIESLGFKVIGTAENGQAGAEMVVKLNPKLVILDHVMPVMNGLECLKAIRLQSAAVRVIVCTAEITEQLSHDYLSYDVSTIVTKPIQLDRFVRAVRGCMAYVPSAVEQDLDQFIEDL